MLLTKIDNELDDLKTGDPFLPPDTDATGALEVVPVHDDVDEQIQRDGHPGHRGQADELRVAEQSRGAVVIAVQEGCQSLAFSTLCMYMEDHSLRGFFLRNKKTVSSSSRYLVK